MYLRERWFFCLRFYFDIKTQYIHFRTQTTKTKICKNAGHHRKDSETQLFNSIILIYLRLRCTYTGHVYIYERQYRLQNYLIYAQWPSWPVHIRVHKWQMKRKQPDQLQGMRWRCGFFFCFFVVVEFFSIIMHAHSIRVCLQTISYNGTLISAFDIHCYFHVPFSGATLFFGLLHICFYIAMQISIHGYTYIYILFIFI